MKYIIIKKKNNSRMNIYLIYFYYIDNLNTII